MTDAFKTSLVNEAWRRVYVANRERISAEWFQREQLPMRHEDVRRALRRYNRAIRATGLGLEFAGVGATRL